MNNSDKFSCFDLFYSPFKKIIKEELPLSENFPYTYNPNRSKNYYTNIELDDAGNISFDNIIKNSKEQIEKFSSLNTSKTLTCTG